MAGVTKKKKKFCKFFIPNSHKGQIPKEHKKNK